MALGPIPDPSFTPRPDIDGRAQMDGFSFVHPAAWRIYPGLPLQPTVNGTDGYVTTEPLHDRCRRSAVANGVEETCGSELDSLTGPHGVFASWGWLTLPGTTMGDTPGEHVTVAGRDARWSVVPAAMTCAKWGGTKTVVATVELGSQAGLLQMSACLVSADEVSAVRAMVDSLKFDDTTTAAPSQGALETSTVGDLTFTHDKRWQLRPVKGAAIPTEMTYTYVSTEPVDAQCSGPSPALAPCGPPVSHLSTHGVFATWRQINQPGLRFDNAAGERLVVDGRPATWSAGVGGACGGSGGFHADGRILMFGNGFGDEIVSMSACLQSPDEFTAVKAMFESARFSGVPRASVPPAVKTVTDTTPDGAVTVTHDAHWRMLTPTEPQAPVAFINGYLSTEAAHDTCATAADRSVTCGSVTVALGPHGVFVTWMERYFPGERFSDAAGETLVVDGKPARWSVGHDVTCAKDGAAISVDARVLVKADPHSDWITSMYACLASADELPAVKAMFESATIRARS
ncbi:MAG: hypothetical protein QOG52_1886 [Frankiaceae bacterium]|nr:hypothetical protein [Frankiaceae bacterium]